MIGLPRAILAEYERYRDFVFAIVPFHLPTWIKDSLVTYLMIATAFVRGLPFHPSYIRSRPLLLIANFLAWPLMIVLNIRSDLDGADADAWGIAFILFIHTVSWLANIATILAATAWIFIWNALLK